jgi:lauroyl/myristoyl acyltransferase
LPGRRSRGTAVLAAKSGRRSFDRGRRHPDGRFFVTHDAPFTVPSTDQAELAAATQRIADALERTIAAAPSSGYSFADLARRPGEIAWLTARPRGRGRGG